MFNFFKTRLKKKKEKEFCCDLFKNYYSLRDQQAPKIRIVKFAERYSEKEIQYFPIKKEERLKKIIQINKRRRFFIFIDIYEVLDFSEVVSIQIHLCPFCGTNLHSFYNDDIYVNEYVDWKIFCTFVLWFKYIKILKKNKPWANIREGQRAYHLLIQRLWQLCP